MYHLIHSTVTYVLHTYYIDKISAPCWEFEREFLATNRSVNNAVYLGVKFLRTGEGSQARKLGGGPVKAGGTTRSGDKYHSITQLNEDAFLG